jgi:uncharacterized RDD family membrane protein YckC
MSEPNTGDIFQSDSKMKLVEADKGKRFLNYLLDAAAISILQTILVNTFDFLTNLPLGSFFQGYKIIFGFNLMFTPVYYLLAEYLFDGKTLGKMVTNTRAVTVNGEKPTFTQLIGRSFARIIPFEPFSYLGDLPNGWHDRLSQTIVIDEQKSTLSNIDDETV